MNFFHSLFYVYLNSLSISVSLTLPVLCCILCAWLCIFAPLKFIFFRPFILVELYFFLVCFCIYGIFIYLYYIRIIIVIILSSLILVQWWRKIRMNLLPFVVSENFFLIDLMTYFFVVRTSSLIVEVMVMCGIYVNLNDFNGFMVRNFIFLWKNFSLLHFLCRIEHDGKLISCHWVVHLLGPANNELFRIFKRDFQTHTPVTLCHKTSEPLLP